MKKSIPTGGMEAIESNEAFCLVRWKDCPIKDIQPFCWHSVAGKLHSVCIHFSYNDDEGVYCDGEASGAVKE